MKHLLLLLCLVSISATTLSPGHKKVKMPKAYVYIPSGTITEGDKKVSIQGFFMSATEVTNREYREFLTDLQQQGRTADYETARIRPEGWNLPNTYQEPLAINYHEHPAYDNYPVVNITREGALLYCEWLSGMLQAQNPGFKVKVRLPLEVEWMYAAAGGHEGLPYPDGYYLRNADGKLLYTFRYVGDENISSAGGKPTVLENVPGLPYNMAPITPSPAKSNYPNDYGLYNTCGNVAEMLAEPGRTKGGCFRSTGYDIRIDAPDEFAGFTGASPFIGFRVVTSTVEK